MPPTETMKMDLHSKTSQCFKQNHVSVRQRPECRKSKRQKKVKKIKKTVLSTTVGDLYSFMKCCGSCQFLRGLWMDISGYVANVYMRELKQRTWKQQQEQFTYLNKRRQINMISMMRKEACSGNIHDLAHIPTQNCCTDCLTKAPVKADNSITAVKSGR